jgi:hypothetical protein
MKAVLTKIETIEDKERGSSHPTAQIVEAGSLRWWMRIPGRTNAKPLTPSGFGSLAENSHLPSM